MHSIAKRTNDTTIEELARTVTLACIDIYDSVIKRFKPTPTRAHYNFNTRNIAQIFNGFMLAPPNVVLIREKMMRLFLHENIRSFHDRLMSVRDRDFFFDMLSDNLRRHFKEIIPAEDLKTMYLRFGTFGSTDDARYSQRYTEMYNVTKLQSILETFMADHNNKPTQRKLHLVFFDAAIEHVCRIARIITQVGG